MPILSFPVVLLIVLALAFDFLNGFHDSSNIVAPEFVVTADGTMAVPTKPGIGVEVLMDQLERVTVRREEFRP